MNAVLEFLIKLWEFLTAVPGFLAILVGLICGVLFTQRYKFGLSELLDPAIRTHKIRMFSAWAGGIPCLLLWPLTLRTVDLEQATGLQFYGIAVGALLATAFTACAPPITYPIIMRYLYQKGWANKERWSADAHADAKRQKRQAMLDALEAAGVGDETLMGVIKSKTLTKVEDVYNKTLIRGQPLKAEDLNDK